MLHFYMFSFNPSAVFIKALQLICISRSAFCVALVFNIPPFLRIVNQVWYWTSQCSGIVSCSHIFSIYLCIYLPHCGFPPYIQLLLFLQKFLLFVLWSIFSFAALFMVFPILFPIVVNILVLLLHWDSLQLSIFLILKSLHLMFFIRFVLLFLSLLYY